MLEVPQSKDGWASPLTEIAVTEVELIQAVLDVQADIDAQFQFWMSVTFAVLIASFVAGGRLTGKLRVLMVALYLLASTLLFLRYLRAMDYFGYVMGLYSTYDLTPPPPAGRFVSISQLRWALFVGGSLVSAAFVLFPSLAVKEHSGGDA